MMKNTFPPILELLCMLLFLAFVVGLAYGTDRVAGVHRQACVPRWKP